MRAVLTVLLLCLYVLLPSSLEITADGFSLRLCDTRGLLFRLSSVWSHDAIGDSFQRIVD